MANNTILFIGCKSTHGGVVITGDPIATVCGVPVSRIGDLHACPQFYPGPSPHGITKIIQGTCSQQRGILRRGRKMALAGDQTPCGAVMLPCNSCTEAVNAC